MSDDLEVILEEEPVQAEYPVNPRRKANVPEALKYDLFERDPYTRRHRSRSMAEVPNMPMTEAVESNNAVSNGLAANGMMSSGAMRSAEV